jgi:soluble lytic murein transglycosylase-like protein
VLARRLLAGCAVLGCVVLAGEAEVVHRHPATATLPSTALPLTGGEAADASGELIRPHPLSAEERHAELKSILAAAAARHGVDPGLVMAVAWWESGWDMTKLSSTGAVGMMQIDPGTAHDLGPKLLGRVVDVHDPYDNADLGAAVLAADLRDAGGNLTVALASYYEGSGNVDPSNLDAGAQAYVEGVTSLQKQYDSGQGP